MRTCLVWAGRELRGAGAALLAPPGPGGLPRRRPGRLGGCRGWPRAGRRQRPAPGCRGSLLKVEQGSTPCLFAMKRERREQLSSCRVQLLLGECFCGRVNWRGTQTVKNRKRIHAWETRNLWNVVVCLDVVELRGTLPIL